MNTAVFAERRNPGCLVQILWFIFIGSWATLLWVAVAWALMVSIIGTPLAVMMLDRVPYILALRRAPRAMALTTFGGRTVALPIEPAQHHLLLRGLWFLVIGWWLSALWMGGAYFLCLSILGLPLGFWMFDAVPAIVSLRR